VIAERIVLLFSPSGAGKTSLLEAGLRKALEAERFRVLPSIRVSATPAQGVTLPPGTNPYVASTLLSLEKCLPSGESLLDGSSPVNLSAIDRLIDSSSGAPQPTVLVFDQFEEVLTMNAADQARKEEFFAQVGQALRDRNRWAIFAMREEYVAPLDPYLRPIPTRLATRYRLDLLGPAAALEAIQQPALAQGVTFAHDAATIVVNDLRRIKVSRLGGGTEEALGPHVEPVQLQVVCRRIWNALPSKATIIDVDTTSKSTTTAATSGTATSATPSTVRELIGGAQEALTGYYEETLSVVAASKGVSERLLRDWFGRELITTQGLRKQVAQDAEETVAIKEAIPALLAAHLVREDARRGGTWYELAHDRLVAPVRESNDRWYRANAAIVERQAALWDQTGRRADLLLQAQDLEEAEQWGRANPDRMTDRVNAFLNESRRADLLRATRRMRWLTGLALGLATIIALAGGLSFFALQLRQTSEKLTSVEEAKNQAEEAKKEADATAAKLEQTVRSAGTLVQSRYADVPATAGGDDTPSPPNPNGTGTDAATPTGSKPAVKIDPTESLAAAIALQRRGVSVAPSNPQRAQIMYYTRDRDNSKLVSELEQLGFQFTVQPSRRSSRASNCVWYGSSVKPEEVKVVALALLRAGVGLQGIKPFENPAGKEWIIEIGNSQQVAANPPLAVEDVERLSTSTPEVYAQPKAATNAPFRPTAAKKY
jgi:Novel STAND NTPase 1